MHTYIVENNKPIKLRVSLVTEAIPMTYTFLESIGETNNGNPDIAPFNPSIKSGWKAINKGGAVKNKNLKVITFLRFFNSFSNEETFNLAIEQIKNTYQVQLMGGEPSIFEMKVVLESQYSSKTCLISSEANLI